jgi:hypothetical protein
MVADAVNGAAEAAKDVEMSKTKDVEMSDSNQDGKVYDEGGGMDAMKKKEKPPLPDFFPSHGLTTAGVCGGRAAQRAWDAESRSSWDEWCWFLMRSGASGRGVQRLAKGLGPHLAPLIAPIGRRTLVCCC